MKSVMRFTLKQIIILSITLKHNVNYTNTIKFIVFHPSNVPASHCKSVSNFFLLKYNATPKKTVLQEMYMKQSLQSHTFQPTLRVAT